MMTRWKKEEISKKKRKFFINKDLDLKVQTNVSFTTTTRIIHVTNFIFHFIIHFIFHFTIHLISHFTIHLIFHFICVLISILKIRKFNIHTTRTILYDFQLTRDFIYENMNFWKKKYCYDHILRNSITFCLDISLKISWQTIFFQCLYELESNRLQRLFMNHFDSLKTSNWTSRFKDFKRESNDIDQICERSFVSRYDILEFSFYENALNNR